MNSVRRRLDPFGPLAELLLAALLVFLTWLYGGVQDNVRLAATGVIGLATLLGLASLRRRGEALYLWGPLHRPAVALALLALAGLPFSIEQHATIMALLQGWAGLAIYYMAFRWMRHRASIKRWLYGFLLFACINAAYGVVLLGLQLPRPWWWHPSFVSGTYVNHNHFAGLLELAIPSLLALSLFGKRPRRRIPATIGLVICATALIMSLSRGGIASCLAACVLMLAVAARIPERPLFALGRKAWIGPAVLVTLAVMAMAGLEPLIHRLELTVEQGKEGLSGEGRWLLYWAALRAFLSKPFLGSGLGNFHLAWLSVRPAGLTGWEPNAHNDYLHWLAETGSLFLPLAGWLVVNFFRYWAHAIRLAPSNFRVTVLLGAGAAVASLLIHSIIDFNLHIPANAWFFCGMAGLVTGYASDGMAPGFHGEFLYKDRRTREDPFRPPPQPAGLMALIWLIPSVLLIGGTWQTWTRSLFIDARSIERERGLFAAEPVYQRVIRWDPISPVWHHAYGSTIIAKTRPPFIETFRNGIHELKTAVELSPRHPTYRLDYARAIETLSNRTVGRVAVYPQVETAWLAMLATDPANAYYQYQVSRYYSRSGDYGKAAKHLLEPIQDPGVHPRALAEWQSQLLSQPPHPEVGRRAIALLAALPPKNPNRELLTQIEARLRMQQQDYDGALKLYRGLFDLNPGNEEKWRMLVGASMEAGRLDDAEQVAFRTGRAFSMDLLEGLVESRAKNQEYDKLLALMDEVLLPEQYTPRLYYRRIWAEIKRGKPGMAEYWAHQWVSRHPDSDAFLWLGRAFAEQGRFTLARDTFLKALDHNKDIPTRRAVETELRKLRDGMERRQQEIDRLLGKPPSKP